MNLKIILLGLLGVIVILSIFFLHYFSSTTPIIIEGSDLDDDSVELITPVVTVDIDRFNQTITILSIKNGTDLFWRNVELISGSATLPMGPIVVGDVITECIGVLDFKWKPTDEIFLHGEFTRGD